jgi:hypothetical protein
VWAIGRQGQLTRPVVTQTKGPFAAPFCCGRVDLSLRIRGIFRNYLNTGKEGQVIDKKTQ